MGSPALVQNHFRWTADDAAPGAGERWIGNVNAAPNNVLTNQNLRLRIEVANTGSGSSSPTLQLEFSTNGGTSWAAVTTGTSVQLAASGQFSNGASLSASMLTATGTWVSGLAQSTSNPAAGIAIAAAYYTEVLFNLKFTTAANGLTYQFRLTNAGTVLNTYSATPTVGPTLSAADQLATDQGLVGAAAANIVVGSNILSQTNGTYPTVATTRAAELALLNTQTAKIASGNTILLTSGSSNPGTAPSAAPVAVTKPGGAVVGVIGGTKT